MTFSTHGYFRPFFRLGIDFAPRMPRRFVLGFGLITLEVHSMNYGKGWWDVDFYIDTWFGNVHANYEFGEWKGERDE